MSGRAAANRPPCDPASRMSASWKLAPRASAARRFSRLPVERSSMTVHLVAAIEERVDEVGADEAGSAGDQGAHGGGS